jgi:hypothetical protein
MLSAGRGIIILAHSCLLPTLRNRKKNDNANIGLDVMRNVSRRDFATPGDVRVEKSATPVGFETQTSCMASNL